MVNASLRSLDRKDVAFALKKQHRRVSRIQLAFYFVLLVCLGFYTFANRVQSEQSTIESFVKKKLYAATCLHKSCHFIQTHLMEHHAST